MLARLCWKPFDTRFSDILAEFRQHERQFMRQLKVTHRLLSVKHLEKELRATDEQNAATDFNDPTEDKKAWHIEHANQQKRERAFFSDR